MTRAPALAVAAALAALACAPGCAEPAPSSAPPAAEADDARFAAGAAAFAKYCALCHGADARGYAADHAPSLVGATFLESAPDEYVARGMREGRRGTAMAAYGKIYGGPLAEADITAVVAFLRDHGPARVRLPTGPVVGDAARGEEIYAASCRPCHGTRTERGNAVHLANPQLLATATDAFLRWAVVHGRPGTPMPAFEGVLREDEIDDVVAALRSWSTPPRPRAQGAAGAAAARAVRDQPGGQGARLHAAGGALRAHRGGEARARGEGADGDPRRARLLRLVREPRPGLGLGAVLPALQARRDAQGRHVDPRLLRLPPPRLRHGRRRAAPPRLPPHGDPGRGDPRVAAPRLSDGEHAPAGVAVAQGFARRRHARIPRNPQR